MLFELLDEESPPCKEGVRNRSQAAPLSGGGPKPKEVRRANGVTKEEKTKGWDAGGEQTGVEDMPPALCICSG
ncbi:MAG: hypothetical protein QXO86_06710 [Nitrososphaerota archaeon]